LSSGDQFSAIVLAGGRSSRMGRPKAALELDGRTIIDRIITELRRVAADIVVVAAPDGVEPTFDIPQGARIVRDELAYQGPLLALARGLDAIAGDGAFACSCDLPLLNGNLAAALVAMLDDYDAVIPEVGGKLQPLHAVYRKRCADALRALASRGENRLTAIADAVRTRRIGENELRALDPELRSFLNVNTPEDLARVRELIG
jgi:molybdopterin-guanine dinucleotide biosynthesis protein A